MTRVRVLAAGIVLLGWATACSSGSDDGPPAKESSADDTPTAPPRESAPHVWTSTATELDVLEAVYRYQFLNNATGRTPLGADTIFLAHGPGARREDPSAELMARFAGHIPAVAPASEADTSGTGVTHKVRGGRGVLFHIDRIRPIDADTFDVDGGYFEAGLSASTNSYRVRRLGEGWKVVGTATWSIS